MNTRPKVTVAALRKKKKSSQKITLLTAYDAPFASFLDQAGIDIVLVSDAIGTIANGRPEAVSVTVDEMVYHTRAVRNGVKSALVVTTLPFGSYNCVNEAVVSATRIMKEGQADAVHLEGTAESAEIVRSIVGSGIPVLGHVGFTKQQMVLSGTIGLPAKDAKSSKRMITDAMAMAKPIIATNVNDMPEILNGCGWIVEPGNFNIMIGSSSADIRISKILTLK